MSSEKIDNSASQVEKEEASTDYSSIGKAMIMTAQIGDKASSSEQKEVPEWKRYVDSLSDTQILDGDFDENKLTQSADNFRVDPYNYLIFRRHAEQSTYEHYDILPNIDMICSKYVEYTRRIVEKLSGENRPDHVIYLDKSARPVSWLVNLFWDDFAHTDSNGEKVKRPEHSYLNIDRTNVLRAHGIELRGDYEEGTGLMTREVYEREKDNFDSDTFAQIRGLYLKEGLKSEDDNSEKIMQLPTTLDGKTVAIVDEVQFTGTTLKIAKDFLEKAFPDTKFQTLCYWPNSLRVTEDGQQYNSSMPVWYPHDVSITTGRGVQDVDNDESGYYSKKLKDFTNKDYLTRNTSGFSEKSPQEQQDIIENAEKKYYPKKKGHNFLSVPLNPDIEDNMLYNSRELAKEMKQMHQDYEDGKILPSVNPKDVEDSDYIRIVRAGINPRKLAEIRSEVSARPRVE